MDAATKFKSIIIWTLGMVLTAALYITMLALTIALYPFDPKRKIVHAQCFWWSDILMALNPYWTVSVSGLDNIDKKKTYVIVSNHQSLADIIVLYKIKMQFKWVAKESLFSVPLIGWCLSLAKHIQIARGEYSSIKKVYRDAAEWLRSDVSVLFFPEGTRSETGKTGEFQNGAFKLAIKERVSVLPIRLSGTGHAIPKGSWIFSTKALCTLKVLPAIDTDGMGPADFGALRDRARNAIISD